MNIIYQNSLNAIILYLYQLHFNCSPNLYLFLLKNLNKKI